MPEFQLDLGVNAKGFQVLDEFTQGYIEAMFFTECASSLYTIDNWQEPETQRAVREGQADGNIPSDAAFSDIHPNSLARIISDCEVFQRENASLLDEAYSRDYDAEQAGRDFWFTRNGHGVGYWDREELKGDDSEYERLTEVMVAASRNGDNAAWDKACAARGDIVTLGDKLSAACRHTECQVWFGDHVDYGDAPFVHYES